MTDKKVWFIETPAVAKVVGQAADRLAVKLDRISPADVMEQVSYEQYQAG
jgi:hypothetical protein